MICYKYSDYTSYKMLGKILFFSLLNISSFYLLHSTKIEDTTMACLNQTDCDDVIQSITEYTTIDDTTITEEPNTSAESMTPFTFIFNKKGRKVNASTPSSDATSHVPVIRNLGLHKIHSDICECDLTLSTCDINCCCDRDCKEYQLTVFSHCEDHPSELYDSRYCYSRNFIQHNNTQYILEKLADNLFCIVYDNLPPMYSVADTLVVNNYKDLKEAMNPSKLKWDMKMVYSTPEFNNTYYYQDKDVLWGIENSIIKPIEMLQAGFSQLCSFKKMLRYPKDWETSCVQNVLENTNSYLIPSTFNNFTVIASPHLFNTTLVISESQVCPKNVCLSITSNYCIESWNNCSSTQPLPASCLNRTCYNIVKGVKYSIVHNGTMGIKSINVYFQIGNISSSFYQHFEVRYKWVDSIEGNNFTRSGNPGYIFGKPVIIGSLVLNKTDNVETKYVLYNFTDGVLSLPMSKRNGQCSQADRYTIAFGENIKLRCSISFQTNNFTTQSCISLQNETLRFWLKDIFFNRTATDQLNLYISKLGNFTDNRTSSWLQVVVDKIPQNVITGYVKNGKLKCTGLVTSVHYEILYSVLSKPQSLTNHQILGIGITFSDEIDGTWTKCNTKNCMDVLSIDIISYVTFHDISKSSKYYFVGGPNLDITLPYDFFYPFLSNSMTTQPSLILISIVICNIFTTKILYTDI